MQAYDSTDRKDSVTTDDLADRTQRALTEYLTVLDDVDAAAGADGLYAVVSESGSQYLVDTRTDSCECPDAEHRDPEGGCKHVRRVAFATGERPIPAAADGLDVDSQLGAHVDGPRWECDHGRTHCAESAGARDDAVQASAAIAFLQGRPSHSPKQRTKPPLTGVGTEEVRYSRVLAASS